MCVNNCKWINSLVNHI